jgi:hypothetical protein
MSRGAVPTPVKPVPAKDGRPSQEALDTAGPSTVDAPAPPPVETPKDVAAKETKDDGCSTSVPACCHSQWVEQMYADRGEVR